MILNKHKLLFQSRFILLITGKSDIKFREKMNIIKTLKIMRFGKQIFSNKLLLLFSLIISII